MSEASDRPSSRRRLLSILAFGVGLALIIAALRVILAQQGLLDAARRSASNAPLHLLILAFLLPAANLFTTALSFHLITRRRGHVRFSEMLALIWAASLLNQLPLRPGLVGRVAYHKAVNNISVADSVRIQIEVLLAAVLAAAAVLLGVLLVFWLGLPDSAIALYILAAILALSLCAWRLRVQARVKQHPPTDQRSHRWRYPACIALRIIDISIWSARYLVFFAIVGAPVNLRGSTAIATAGQAAMMAPVPMGLREWAVGSVSAILPDAYRQQIQSAPSSVSSAPNHAPLTPPVASSDSSPDLLAHAAPGFIADLANRGVELLITIPGGLLACLLIARRWRRALAAHSRLPPSQPTPA